MDVTEIECEVVPYTDCKMLMEVQTYRSSQDVPKTFTKQICTEGMKTIQHEKMMPNCVNVTKQNCITLWETDAEGKQVSFYLF